MNERKVYISLSAFVRHEWGAMAAVPANTTKAELETIIDRFIEKIPTEKYEEVISSWDQDEGMVEEIPRGMGRFRPDYRVVRGPGGALGIEEPRKQHKKGGK